MPETTIRKFGLCKKIRFLLFNGRQSSSVEQLSRDFGEYPPQPLTGKITDYTFDILHPRNKISNAIYANYAAFKMLISEAKNNSEEFKVLKKEMQGVARKGIRDLKTPLAMFTQESKNLLKAAINNKKYHYLPGYILIVALGILFILALYITIITSLLFIAPPYFIYRVGKSMAPKESTMGHFMSQESLSNQIVVFRKANDSDFEATVSHEHLHFLQYKTRGSSFDKLDIVGSAEHLFSPDALNEFSQDPEHKQHFNYLANPAEVEARLHEVMIAFYHANQRLPANAAEFIEAMMACSKIIQGTILKHLTRALDSIDDTGNGEKLPLLLNHSELQFFVLKKLLDAIQEYKESPDECNLFFGTEKISQRDPSALKDLEYIIIYLCVTDVQYIFEVLPNFYANLVEYYGDIETSNRIRQEVPKTEFYYQLYPENAA